MARRRTWWHRWRRVEGRFVCDCGLSVTKTEHDRGVRTPCTVDRRPRAARLAEPGVAGVSCA